MLLSEQMMVAICETVASGVLVLSRAAEMNGVSRRSLWKWLEESKRGEDERYLIAFPTDEKRPFHVAIARARRMAAIDIRSEFEARALRGHDEIVHFQGQVVWQMDPRAVGLDPDIREMLGYDRDGYLRNERGECIPVKQHIQPPVAAVVKVLAAHFKQYGDRVEQNINLRGGVTLGVQAVGMSSRADGPPAIPPAPPRPVLDVTPPPAALPVPEAIVDAEFSEPDATADTAPMVEEEFAAAPMPEPTKPEVVIRETPPPEYQPVMTDQARDLLTRLRGPVGLRSANPVGSIKATKPMRSAYD
ncbi:hypothetical protein HU230_0036790 [Bradyrhizobium quebecense]|uniref:Uncharacterized protein n=1 Tax=Bradyrhizobium quebecense TaxID=2748629 RepID=A0A973WX92_9BRAD|nr:hypothetical protein [Bradyrhizobium quebecense]UGA43747.1 hypothetical protein HU230_0036790 [Bradyrhizobium quebecense]